MKEPWMDSKDRAFLADWLMLSAILVIVGPRSFAENVGITIAVLLSRYLRIYGG